MAVEGESKGRPFTHVVTTRFGIGIGSDAWFRNRFRIFRAICFPSLRGQTTAFDHWIVSCDARAPAWLDDEFARLRAELPGLELRRIDPFSSGSFNPLPKRNLRALAKGNLVLSSRIDDDDCWHRDYVARLHETTKALIAQGRDRVAVTFYEGHEFSAAEGTFQGMSYPWHSMAVNVLSPIEPLMTCNDFGHTRASARLREDQYTLLEYADGTPYWLYLRHAGADSAYKGLKATGEVVPVDDAIRSRVREQFNVDLAEVAELTTRETAPIAVMDMTHPMIKAILAARRTGVGTQLEIKLELLKIGRTLRQEGKAEEAEAVRRLFYAEPPLKAAGKA